MFLLNLRRQDPFIYLCKPWNLWHTMAIVISISHMIHICPTQILHWCPTRLSTWSSSVLPLVPNLLVRLCPRMAFHTVIMRMTCHSFFFFHPETLSTWILSCPANILFLAAAQLKLILSKTKMLFIPGGFIPLSGSYNHSRQHSNHHLSSVNKLTFPPHIANRTHSC